jgi:hypothetical protein
MGKTSVKFLKDELSKIMKLDDRALSLFVVAENINREQLVYAYKLGVNEKDLEDELLDKFENAHPFFNDIY